MRCVPKAADALTLQLLAWIADRPRTYVDTIAAWRTSCPRLTIWEDACDDGLIHVERGQTAGESTVSLTRLGRAALDGRCP
jgi:hypothetical protein